MKDSPPPLFHSLIDEWRRGLPVYRDAGVTRERLLAELAYAYGWAEALKRFEATWPEPIDGKVQPPTAKDAHSGRVQFLDCYGRWDNWPWQAVAEAELPWRHCPGWKSPAPPEPTLTEQALARLRDELKETCRARNYNKWEVLDLAVRALEQSGEGVE